MAVQTTEEFLNGGASSYTIAIEYLKEADIKVRINGALQTYTTGTPGSGEYSVSGTTVTLGAASPSGNGVVHVYRETDVNTAAAVFAAGSSIRSKDLNAIHDMARFASVEHRNQVITDDIRDEQVTSAKIKNATIVDADISGSAAIAQSKIATGTLPSGVQVASANIVDGTIVNDDVNNSAAIAGTKITPNFGSQNIVTTGTGATGNLGVTGNITVSGNVDGRDIAADGTKLDTIETNAKDDQTAAEIRTLVESATNSNVFTDADHTKLNGIEPAATADQTNAEIKTAYEANANTNEYSDAEQQKLAAIEPSATADQTAGEIKTLLQSDKLTLSEMNTTSLDSRYYTETEAEGLFLRQDSSETIASGVAWSGTDSKVATTAAIDARIIDLLDDTGGFVPLANETSFPAANPDINNGAGTVVSVKAVSTNLTPSSGTVTIANGAGTGNTVTITGVTGVIPSGFGMILETTSTLHTYAFHRLQAKATEVNTVATNITNVINCGQNLADIENFADLYQISTTAPTTRADGTALTIGDLWFDSSSNQVMMVYDNSAGDGFSPITPNQATITAINSVSGHVTYTEDLGLVTESINTGSGNNSINTVGANIAAVNTVAADLNETTSEIDTVANSITNVDIVGNAITNVNAVGTNISNVNAAATNATNINAAVANATNINSAVANASNINTVAGSIADVNRYAAEYLIQSGTPSSPSGGDLWYNSTANTLNYYTGSTWVGISPGIAGVINDANPALANHLDCNDKNLTEVGTVSGDNLQIDFGTL